MYKYETHMHTSEASKCGNTPAHLYPEYYKKLGYDGIFITDHFFNGNTCISRHHTWEERVCLFCHGYENARKAAEDSGFKVFFGLEYSFGDDEFLLYGIDKEWLIGHPEIMDCNRESLYYLIHGAGGLMVQAHPYRERGYISAIHLSPNYCDAWEAYNAHNNDIQNANALSFCEQNDIFITAGSDLHKIGALSENSLFGMCFDKPLQCEADYVNAILNRRGTPAVPANRIVKPGEIITSTPVIIH